MYIDADEGGMGVYIDAHRAGREVIIELSWNGMADGKVCFDFLTQILLFKRAMCDQQRSCGPN